MGCMCLFQFWFPQGICLGVGLLGHMVVLVLVFKGISILPFIVAVSIYVPTNIARAFLFINSSINGHLGCFIVLAIVNSAAMNIRVHRFFSVLISSWYMPRSGTAGSYGGFIPSF